MTAPDQMKTHANAVITVRKYEPSAYDVQAEGPALTRIHVEESFSGDISGNGLAEFLQAARADGSASFVGIERVTGAPLSIEPLVRYLQTKYGELYVL